MDSQGTTPALPVPAWTLAVAAMFCVQLGSALSLPLIEQVGPAGTAWLRLSAGALIFLALARPSLRGLERADVPAVIALGVTTGVMTSLFLASIARIPLGTTVAIEPTFGLILGLIVLHQRPSILQLLGIMLVVLAGAGAQRNGRRQMHPPAEVA